MTNYILAPNARWQGRNQTGQPCVGGKLYTYVNETVVPKATYQNYQHTIPNTNPVILDAKGEANIYWDPNELYTIKLFTADDEEVYTQDNYPVVDDSVSPPTQSSDINICRNAQFFYWSFGTNFSPVSGTGSQNDNDFVCDDWLYKRVGTGYTVNITRQSFAIDQDEVPGNPTYFIRYEGATPSGETNNRLYQRYKSVRTLAEQSVAVSLYAKSLAAGSMINVYLVQNFGTGGSPSAEVATLVGQFTLTTDWSRYSGIITLPSLTGKTVGSNNDDALLLRINYPNDTGATIDIVNVQMEQNTVVSPFPFTDLDTQYHQLDSAISNGIFTTGDIKPTFKNTADPGWLMMSDQTIGNVGSGATNTGIALKALYTTLWNNVLDAWAPVSTGRGVSAEADFNAGKTLTLCRQLGRLIGGAGSGATLTARALGEYGGAEAATIGIANMPAHDHPGSAINGVIENYCGSGGSSTYNTTGGAGTSSVSVASQGSDTALPIMNPFAMRNYMIKI